MNIKVILGIIAVVVIAAGLYWFVGRGESGEMMNTKTANNGVEQAAESFTGTISDLFSKKTPLQCDFTYTDTDSGNTSSGSVYVSGDKMRGDFEVTPQGAAPTQTSMIRQEDVVYTWGFEPGKGYKMEIDDSMVEEAKDRAQGYTAATNDKSSFDPNQQAADYNCRPWSVDASVFTPPSDIEFQDMSAMMEQMQQINNQTQGAADHEKACAACDSAPESARASCRQALGC